MTDQQQAQEEAIKALIQARPSALTGPNPLLSKAVIPAMPVRNAGVSEMSTMVQSVGTGEMPVNDDVAEQAAGGINMNVTLKRWSVNNNGELYNEQFHAWIVVRGGRVVDFITDINDAPSTGSNIKEVDIATLVSQP